MTQKISAHKQKFENIKPIKYLSNIDKNENLKKKKLSALEKKIEMINVPYAIATNYNITQEKIKILKSCAKYGNHSSIRIYGAKYQSCDNDFTK